MTRRALALVVLLALVAGFMPPPARAVAPPLRYPHETARAGTAKQNWDYALTLKGSGFTPLTIPFDSLDARSICVFWTAGPTSATVVARAYAMANGGRLLATGQPVPAWVPTTLDVLTEERLWWKGPRLNTGWRSTPVLPRDGNSSCLTSVGYTAPVGQLPGPFDNLWLSQAVRSTNYATTRAMIEMGVAYFNQRLLLGRLNAQYLQVFYELRPSLAFVHFNLSEPVAQRLSMDVVQEPRMFTGTPTVPVREEGGHIVQEPMPVGEQITRWRNFMMADAITAGIVEGYALGIITQKSAMSGTRALLEAEGRHEAIVTLLGPADLGKLSGTTEPATRAKIGEALAVPGTRVRVTVAPTTASNGWRGTPWIAWNMSAAQGAAVGTYLGVLRGAKGEAGANPSGTAAADAAAHASSLGTVAAALAGLGAFFSLGPFGPVGRAVGHSFAAMAAVVGAVAAALSVASATAPKTGHVDAAPTTDPTEQGENLPEGIVTIGPISEITDGSAPGVGGVGADGTSGPGGCGCGPGDPGQGLGGEI